MTRDRKGQITAQMIARTFNFNTRNVKEEYDNEDTHKENRQKIEKKRGWDRCVFTFNFLQAPSFIFKTSH